MAAPDRAYRHTTNLQGKDSGGNVKVIRGAKPAAWYTGSAVTEEAKIQVVKDRFKLDGWIWLKTSESATAIADDPGMNMIEIKKTA